MADNDPRLTDEQIKDLLEMRENYQRGRWLGRLIWKIAVAVGATIAGVAALKDHLTTIFSRGG